MKIGSVDVFAYVVRYAHGEYVMSRGRGASSQDGTLVRVRSDDGLEGWGEVTPLGATYLPTFAGGVVAALAELAPAILGEDPTNIARITQVMDAVMAGQQFAKSAIDIACWDLYGKAVERPVVDILGGRLQDDFPLYEAVPLGPPDSMAEFVTRRMTAGINRFQLKVGNEPAEDIERVQATCAVASPDTVIIADANGGWTQREAQQAIRGMAGLDVYIEQPCKATEDCALAHRGSLLPLILDESVVSLRDLYQAKYAAGAAVVNLKIGRLGGLTNMVRIRDLAQELNLEVCIEDTWGGDVTTAAVSHLAAGTLPDFLLTASFFNDWTDGHVAGHQPRSVNGRGAAPTNPGLGIEVDERSAGELLFSERR